LKKDAARRGYYYRKMKRLVVDMHLEAIVMKFEIRTLLLSCNHYFDLGKKEGQKETESVIKKLEQSVEEYREKFLEVEEVYDVLLKKAIYYPNSLPKVTTIAIKSIDINLTPTLKKDSEIHALEDFIAPFRPKFNLRKRKKRIKFINSKGKRKKYV